MAEKLKDIIKELPAVAEYLIDAGLISAESFENEEMPAVAGSPELEKTPEEFFAQLDESILEELEIKQEEALADFNEYVEALRLLSSSIAEQIDEITILPGHDKNGKAEKFDSITIKRGEIWAVVGNTGSGKSRLLQDIEWLAAGDTPTGRRILTDGREPDAEMRYMPQNKPVAELSQNMNFVMDLNVRDFLEMHADSRMVADKAGKCEQIIEAAVGLAGEAFDEKSQITSLSGGQSRALMIADTAFLSPAPIVLIDELENAGIDKRKALATLTAGDKMILMATHDPVLALMADKRLIIKNGAISDVLSTSEEEREVLRKLLKYDESIRKARSLLRAGKRAAL